MNGIDLMAHPLAGNTGGVRPEQTKLQVLSRIPCGFRTIQLKALPIGIFLATLGYRIDAPPATGLIDVPSHLHADDLTKLAGLNEFGRGRIVRSAPPLRADLNNAFAVVDS